MASNEDFDAPSMEHVNASLVVEVTEAPMEYARAKRGTVSGEPKGPLINSCIGARLYFSSTRDDIYLSSKHA